MLSQHAYEFGTGSGLLLSELLPGDELYIETENHCYHLLYSGRGDGFLTGHPVYCPESLLVSIRGSAYGRKMFCPNFIGQGFQLEFRHPRHACVVTSRIRAIRRGAKLLPRAPGRD